MTQSTMTPGNDNPKNLSNESLPDLSNYFDDDREYGDDTCPNCGETYDDIDREYQICHICKFNNTKHKMIKGAVISDCGKYRYQLWRIWDESKPCVLWIMHNPSTADAEEDDPTIGRCIEFSTRWGYGGIYVGNLSPYRATKPDVMKGKRFSELFPVENIIHTNEMKKKCSLFVLAYGNPIRKDMKYKIFDDCWMALKLTKSGNPWHPLYVKGDTKLFQFNSKQP